MTTDCDLWYQRKHAVADQIVRHGKEHFDMDEWFHDPGEAGPLEINMVGAIDIQSCGTTACAAGHAALCALEQGVYLDNALKVAAWMGLQTTEDWAPALFFQERWDDWLRVLGSEMYGRTDDTQLVEAATVVALLRWMADQCLDEIPEEQPDGFDEYLKVAEKDMNQTPQQEAA